VHQINVLLAEMLYCMVYLLHIFLKSLLVSCRIETVQYISNWFIIRMTYSMIQIA